MHPVYSRFFFILATSYFPSLREEVSHEWNSCSCWSTALILVQQRDKANRIKSLLLVLTLTYTEECLLKHLWSKNLTDECQNESSTRL
jgi:hypothetical protein